MKNICVIFLIILAILFCCYSESNCQTAASVRNKIELANKKFVKWFNSIQPDSIITQYHADACITGKGCGKEFIQKYYQSETGKYTVQGLTTLTVTVKDNAAVETGQWKILLGNGAELSGKYSTEWRLVNSRWVIFKETVLE